MSQSVKQCITVDLFLHILASVVDIQKVHLLLHTPLLNKTPRLSSVRTFVRLYRLLLIHCIYVSVTKPTCPAFSAWLNTGAIRSLKVTGKAMYSVVTAMCSNMAHLMLVQCVIASHAEVWTCEYWWKFYQELTDHCTGPRRNGSVNSRSTLCQIERWSC